MPMRSRGELLFHVAFGRWLRDYEQRCKYDKPTTAAEDALFDAFSDWSLPLDLVEAMEALAEEGVR